MRSADAIERGVSKQGKRTGEEERESRGRNSEDTGKNEEWKRSSDAEERGVRRQNKVDQKRGGNAEERIEDRVKKEWKRKADVDEGGKETEERTAQEESRRI